MTPQEKMDLHNRRIAAPHWSVWHHGMIMLDGASLAVANEYVGRYGRGKEELEVRRNASWREPGPGPLRAA